MIERLSGTLLSTDLRGAVIGVYGVGLRVNMAGRTLGAMPAVGETVELFTHLNVKEDALDLYGFLREAELRFFELLISVSGVGPRSALSVLEVGDLADLEAAIVENRPDLLSRASGVGKKTAERIILELRTKIKLPAAEGVVRRMDTDADLLETLVNLGYRREEAKAALQGVDPKTNTLEARLKDALARLARHA